MAISPFLHSLSFFTRRTARESANSAKCSATKWTWKAKQAKQHSKKKSTYKNSSIFNYLIKCILCAIKVPSISTDNDSELCVCVCVDCCHRFAFSFQRYMIAAILSIAQCIFLRGAFVWWFLVFTVATFLCVYSGTRARAPACVCLCLLFSSWIYQPRLKINYGSLHFYVARDWAEFNVCNFVAIFMIKFQC